MLLREFFTYDSKTKKTSEDQWYSPSRDQNRLRRGDTRKTRLTLRQINRMRVAREVHDEELKRERAFIARMYASPLPE